MNKKIILAFLGIFLLGTGSSILFFDYQKTNLSPNLSSSNLINYTYSANSAGFSPNGDFVIEHRSHPTKMSLQGRVTGADGNLIDDGNLTTIVSDQNSCVSGVFYQITYPNAIQDGFFNILLGDQNVLSLNYNQDYYLCLKVNDELLSGPAKFVGGQGEINTEDVADNFSFNDLNVSDDLKVNGDFDVKDGNFFPPTKTDSPSWGNIKTFYYDSADSYLYYRDTNNSRWVGFSETTFSCAWGGSTASETACNFSQVQLSSGSAGKGFLLPYDAFITYLCAASNNGIGDRNFTVYRDAVNAGSMIAPAGVSESCQYLGINVSAMQRISLTMDNSVSGTIGTIWLVRRSA